MVTRRRVLAAAAVVPSVTWSGCLSSGAPTSGSERTWEEHEEDFPKPDPSDLECSIVPQGAVDPRTDSRAESEFVWIQNTRHSEVSLNGLRVRYSDGHEYTFGSGISVTLPEGGEVEVHSTDRGAAKFLRYPPIYKIGTDHPDRPVLDRESEVTISLPSGNELLSI